MTQKKFDSFVEEVKTAEVSDEYGPGNERWEMRPLSELIEPVLGKTPKRSEDKYWGGDIQWASAKDISQSETRHVYDTAENMTEAGKEASNAKVLPKGTVVVVARGSVGEVIQLGEPMTFNQSCYALDTNDQLLDDYLYYAWQYVFGQVQAVSYGTVFDTITMKSFEDIEIPIPSVGQQRKIADVLSKFDDKIELNQYLTNNLYESVATQFKNKFRSVVEKPGAEDDYKEVNLPALIEIVLGGTPDSNNDEYWGGDIDWIKAKDITNSFSEFVFSTEKKITEKGVKESSTAVVKKDTIIITARGTVGKTILTPHEMAVNQTCYALVPKDNEQRFYIYVLVNRLVQELQSRTHGTVFDTINMDTLREQTVLLPPRAERIEFNNNSEPFFEEIRNLGYQCETLAETRDSLLPVLLSGEVVMTP